MPGIICAMHCEPAPPITQYELKKMDSRVAEIRADEATAFFFSSIAGKDAAIVNAGVAGILFEA